MIPLIDIALTLLIIMMVTTAFVHHPGVSLKLPETVTREGAPETNKDLTIVVTADGNLYVDGQVKSAEEVQGQLRAVSAHNKQSRILVKGDRGVVYAKVMEVMDMVRQAGLTRVVLPTDPRLGGAPQPNQTQPATTGTVPDSHPALGPADEPAGNLSVQDSPPNAVDGNPQESVPPPDPARAKPKRRHSKPKASSPVEHP